MTSVGKVTEEQSAEPTGIDRLDPWMRRHPQYVAGIWAVFALISALSAIFAKDGGAMLALNVAMTLGWMILSAREVRRYRAQR